MKPATEDVVRVARKLWGPENEALSNRNELRFGSNGGRSLKLSGLVWKDHETGEGGGYVKLFQMADAPLPEAVADTFIAATYDYRDERGALLFQVVRQPKHSFLQRRPTAGAPGKWTWNTKGVRRVLYRLPELLAADSDAPVFIPEGEKDVDNVRSLGLTAICNSCGAGKWKPEYGQHLGGRDLVVLPDNDQAGRDHAALLVRSLVGAARSIRVLELPDLAPNGDVSDWLGNGGTREKLVALVEATPAVKQANGACTHTNGDGASSHADEAEVSDDQAEKELRCLATLPRLRYARERLAAAKMLGVPAGILDRLVKAERGGDGDTNGQGRPLDLPLPQPWPDAVNGAVLCHDVACFFDRYAALPEHAAIALALWSIHTHCFDLWRYSPRLHMTAPTRRAGKTRVLNLLNLLVAKPLKTESVTPPALFRTVEMARPTMLLDECNALLDDNAELVALLNSGFECNGMVVRTVGDAFEPRQFSVFGPVAMAGIGSLARTLSDRCITVPMQRALPSERRPKITAETEAEAERLSRQIVRWVRDHRAALVDAHPDVGHLPDRIDDRWFPLFAIAGAAGADWPRLVNDAALGLTPDDDDSASQGEHLVRDIHRVLGDWIADYPTTTQHEIASAELTERLVALPASRWAEMGRSGRPLTSLRLARMLWPFKVRPISVGSRDDRRKGYRLTDFAPVFAHILGQAG
jgi:hypothetical protein